MFSFQRIIIAFRPQQRVPVITPEPANTIVIGTGNPIVVGTGNPLVIGG